MVGNTAPKRFRIAVNMLAVLAATALVLSGWAFYTRIHESRHNQTRTVQAIRTVLCFAQQQVEDDPDIPATRKLRAVRFYTAALAKIDALPCHPLTGGPRP